MLLTAFVQITKLYWTQLVIAKQQIKPNIINLDNPR